MKDERYGELLNRGVSSAFPRPGRHPGYDINVGTQLIAVQPARFGDYTTAPEFSALFTEIKTEAPYASYLDLTRVKHRVFSTTNVFGMMPEQISTLEVSVFNRVTHIDDEGDEHETLTYELPRGLELAQHLSALIIHYPAHFSELDSFEVFMKDVNAVVEALPNLRYVYFTTFNRSERIEDAPRTRAKILEALSSSIPEYRFYASNSATDELVLTRPSTSESFTPSPIAQAAPEAPPKEVLWVPLEALEALAGLSTFSPKKTRNISIDIVWKGPVQTITRKYTRVTVHQNSDLAVGFPISDTRGTTSTLALGIAEHLVPDKFEVHIHFIKCSMKRKNYVRGIDGQFTESPIYIGDGIYKFTIGSDLEKGDIKRYKLVIDNLTPIHSDRVEISANLEPIGALDEDIAPQSNTKPTL